MKLCFATNNEHKLKEVQVLLDQKFQLVSLRDIGCIEELPETTGTIPGNSKQKAEFVFSKYNIDCFADDSGLEVEALNNEPGVDSAIYAGLQRSHTDNIQLLLKNLKGIANRKARFVTVITLVILGKSIQFEGVLEGEIINKLRGSGGFGYDPIFVPNGNKLTLAEMKMVEKNAISHRAKAVRQLSEYLESNFSR